MAITLKGANGIYEGTSGDNKPIDVPINTEFHELDTDKMYYFDGTNWNEEPSSEGGGFTPTTEQLAAMNSGITAERLATDENNISYVIENSVQNLLPPLTSAKTSGNVTFTPNADGSISMTGQKNVSTETYVELATVTFADSNIPKRFTAYTNAKSTGPYIMTIIPRTSTGYGSTIVVTSYTDVNFDDSVVGMLVRAKFNGANGDTANGKIYPMICDTNLYSANPHFVRYAMSNAELTAAIQALQAQLANQ